MRLSVLGARLLGRKEQEVVAAGADPALQADQHLLEERVADIGVLQTRVEDDADELRPLANEGARGRARRVIELTRRFEDTLPCRRADVVVPVEDARDGRNGNAAQLRDLVDRGDSRPPLRKRFRRRRYAVFP